MTLYGKVKHNKPLALSTRDRRSLSRIGNAVRWDVVEDDNGGLAVIRLNEPHQKQKDDHTRTWEWYYTSQDNAHEVYETFVIGKFYDRRREIEALIEEKWAKERSEMTETLKQISEARSSIAFNMTTAPALNLKDYMMRKG